VLAVVAMVLQVFLLLAGLAALRGTHRPGIAGIILTIGMAVDANVLIYERIRERSGTTRPCERRSIPATSAPSSPLSTRT